MSNREAVHAALAAWREADRRLTEATDGRRGEFEREIVQRRSEYHALSGAHIMERMGALHRAEQRRQASTPSTDEFHGAARDEKDIAADIWEAARSADEDIPRRSPT